VFIDPYWPWPSDEEEEKEELFFHHHLYMFNPYFLLLSGALPFFQRWSWKGQRKDMVLESFYFTSNIFLSFFSVEYKKKKIE
jgi:hypothetical protein